VAVRLFGPVEAFLVDEAFSDGVFQLLWVTLAPQHKPAEAFR
jgi:hypothetical protein